MRYRAAISRIAFLGDGIGALIGSASHGEHWQTISLDPVQATTAREDTSITD
jgi:hypothetical protein